MRKCIICGRRNNDVSYFKPPDDERRKRLWETACRTTFSLTAKVCSIHFAKTDLIVGGNRLKLMPSAVPSLEIVFPKNDRIVSSSYQSKQPALNDCEERDPLRCDDFLKETLVDIVDVQNIDRLDRGSEEYTCGAAAAVKRVDVCSQTDNDYLISISEIENYKLRNEVRKLKSEVYKLQELLLNCQTINTSINKIFTEGQIRKLEIPDRNIKWRPGDIAACMPLYKCSPKAYKYLYEKGYPLPHVTSLLRWARTKGGGSGGGGELTLNDNDSLNLTADESAAVIPSPNEGEVFDIIFDEIENEEEEKIAGEHGKVLDVKIL